MLQKWRWKTSRSWMWFIDALKICNASWITYKQTNREATQQTYCSVSEFLNHVLFLACFWTSSSPLFHQRMDFMRQGFDRETKGPQRKRRWERWEESKEAEAQWYKQPLLYITRFALALERERGRYEGEQWKKGWWAMIRDERKGKAESWLVII